MVEFAVAPGAGFKHVLPVRRLPGEPDVIDPYNIEAIKRLPRVKLEYEWKPGIKSWVSMPGWMAAKYIKDGKWKGKYKIVKTEPGSFSIPSPRPQPKSVPKPANSLLERVKRDPSILIPLPHVRVRSVKEENGKTITSDLTASGRVIYALIANHRLDPSKIQSIEVIPKQPVPKPEPAIEPAIKERIEKDTGVKTVPKPAPSLRPYYPPHPIPPKPVPKPKEIQPVKKKPAPKSTPRTVPKYEPKKTTITTTSIPQPRPPVQPRISQNDLLKYVIAGAVLLALLKR